MKYKVLAITHKSEKEVHSADTCAEAIEWAMPQNKSPYNTIYIVVCPDGYRMSVSEQEQFLKAA